MHLDLSKFTRSTIWLDLARRNEAELRRATKDGQLENVDMLDRLFI